MFTSVSLVYEAPLKNISDVTFYLSIQIKDAADDLILIEEEITKQKIIEYFKAHPVEI